MNPLLTAVENNKDRPKCDHYSKKFLFDYTVVGGKRGTGDETTELKEFANITQAVCAKLCSEWSDAEHVSVLPQLPIGQIRRILIPDHRESNYHKLGSDQ